MCGEKSSKIIDFAGVLREFFKELPARENTCPKSGTDGVFYWR